MARFYLLEPALKGLGGHYYEYATYVLAAAVRAGFATTLATHRQLDAETVAAIVDSGVVTKEGLHPVFCYEHYVKPDEFAWLRAAMGILEGTAKLASPLAAVLQRLALDGPIAQPTSALDRDAAGTTSRSCVAIRPGVARGPATDRFTNRPPSNEGRRRQGLHRSGPWDEGQAIPPRLRTSL